MPAYTYLCEKCEYKFDTFHSMSEELHDCEQCNSAHTLKRVPQLLTSYSKQKSEREMAGERVNKAIEDNRKLLLEQKQNINRDYKP